MRKTTLVVDDALVERAQEILGTRGLKATVDRALLEVIELDARRRAVAQLHIMDGLDLDREDVMAEAWR
jgi:Arc/MetJ family transcription regulator